MNYTTDIQPAHFVHNYLLRPYSQICVNLIGAGGTGSQVLSALARINKSLIAHEHAGLQVRLFDSDTVTEANLARQLFFDAELGMNKAVALINRFNLAYGTNWKAFPHHYDEKNLFRIPKDRNAFITITCVDTPQARFEIAAILCRLNQLTEEKQVNRPRYWMDFGNSRYTGQVMLSTLSPIEQPTSQKFIPVAALPLITDVYKDLLHLAAGDDTPSCSLAEALRKQDLFINSSLASLGASLLWQMFTEGKLVYKGFFHNIKEFNTQPIPIDMPAAQRNAA